MTLETILLLAVLVPTIGAFALPLVSGLSRRLRNGVAFVLVATALVCSAALVPSASAGQGPTVRL